MFISGTWRCATSTKNSILIILIVLANKNVTTAQVVETSVTINNNSPIQDYVHPDDHTQYEMTPGFKPFTKNKGLCTHHCFYLRCLPPFITSLFLSYGEGKYMERSNDTSHAKSYVHGNFGFFSPFGRGCAKPYWDLAQTNPHPTSLPFFLIAYYRELRHPEGEFEIFCSFQNGLHMFTFEENPRTKRSKQN